MEEVLSVCQLDCTICIVIHDEFDNEIGVDQAFVPFRCIHHNDGTTSALLPFSVVVNLTNQDKQTNTCPSQFDHQKYLTFIGKLPPAA